MTALRCSLIAAAAMLGCHRASAPFREGVYSLCSEVAGFSGETLELKDGTFRYWFHSDVGVDGEPTYPLTGAYSISSDRLILDHPGIHKRERTIAVVNGVDVLWREDGLDLWTREKRIHPYAVLIRLDGVTDGSNVGIGARPSLDGLLTQRMKDRLKQEHDKRFEDQPAEVRSLLRALTMDADPDLETYRREITRARSRIDPKLLSQLVALLHRDSPARIEAGQILEDLFLKTHLVEERPPFLESPDSRRRALETLIDALAAAQDRYALEECVLLFLSVSEVRKIALRIAGTDVRIVLEWREDGTKVMGSSGPSDVRWRSVLPKVIPACQQWMREQLPK